MMNILWMIIDKICQSQQTKIACLINVRFADLSIRRVIYSTRFVETKEQETSTRSFIDARWKNDKSDWSLRMLMLTISGIYVPREKERGWNERWKGRVKSDEKGWKEKKSGQPGNFLRENDLSRGNTRFYRAQQMS